MKGKRILSLILSIAMILSLAPATLAAQYNDSKGHWAESSIDRWSDSGVVNGHNGAFHPDGDMTVAELATTLSDLLGYTEIAPNTFADLRGDEWYAEDVLKAVAAGVLQGDGRNINATTPADYERTMVVFARALHIGPDANPDLRKFTDGGQVSDWAAGYLSALSKANIISGVGNGKLAPDQNIKRGSVMKVMDNAITHYVTEGGTYDIQDGGIVVVKTGEAVTLTGATRDIVFAPGSSQGNLTLDQVQVTGAIAFEAANAKVVAKDSALANVILGASGAALELQGTSTSKQVVVEEKAKDATLNVGKDASIGMVETAADHTSISGGGKIGTLMVTGGTGTNVSKDTQVDQVQNNSQSDVTVGDKVIKPGTTTDGNTNTGGSSGGSSGGNNPSPVPVITINNQPHGTTVTVGTAVTLQVDASVTQDAILDYQWYSLATETTDKGYGIKIDMDAGKSYQLTVDAQLGDQFYFCRVSATGGATSVDTNTVKVTGTATPAKSYTVSFDTAIGAAPASVSVVGGQKAAKPADPAADGYELVGWYTTAAFATAWDFASDTVTADMTLYAKWASVAAIDQMEDAVYQIGYHGWANKPGNVSDFGVLTYTPSGTDIAVTGEAKWISGFTGFNTTVPAEQEGYYAAFVVPVPSGLTATGTIATFTGSAPVNAQVSNLDVVNGKSYLSMLFRLGDATTVTFQDDYTVLVDWDGTAADIDPTTYTLDFSAVTKQTTHTLTYDYNGAIGATAPVKIAEGAAYGTLPTPTRDGFTHTGWFDAATGGNSVTAATLMGTSDTTIYAQWASKVTVAALENTANFLPATWGTVPDISKMTLAYTKDADSDAYTVTGNLYYVGTWTEFNTAVPDEQSGYYAAVALKDIPSSVDASQAIITLVNGESGTSDKTLTKANLDHGGTALDLIVHVAKADASNASKTMTFKVDWDGATGNAAESTYTIDFSGANLLNVGKAEAGDNPYPNPAGMAIEVTSVDADGKVNVSLTGAVAKGFWASDNGILLNYTTVTDKLTAAGKTDYTWVTLNILSAGTYSVVQTNPMLAYYKDAGNPQISDETGSWVKTGVEKTYDGSGNYAIALLENEAVTIVANGITYVITNNVTFTS